MNANCRTLRDEKNEEYCRTGTETFIITHQYYFHLLTLLDLETNYSKERKIHSWLIATMLMDVVAYSFVLSSIITHYLFLVL